MAREEAIGVAAAGNDPSSFTWVRASQGPARYSTPPPASNSSGITPVRTRTSGGPQSPRSGSPVLDHAMTPAWVPASRFARPRADAAEGAGFRLKGHDAAVSLLECLHDVEGVRRHG